MNFYGVSLCELCFPDYTEALGQPLTVLSPPHSGTQPICFPDFPLILMPRGAGIGQGVHSVSQPS